MLNILIKNAMAWSLSFYRLLLKYLFFQQEDFLFIKLYKRSIYEKHQTGLSGIGYFFLRACWFKCVGGTNNYRLIFQIMLLIAVVTGPLIPITSISAVPLFCCMFSLAGLPFVRRRLKNVATDQLKEESAVMTA